MIARPCSKCDSTIFIAHLNGIPSAFEDSMLSMPHRCHGAKIPSSVTERVSLLEKIVRNLYDKMQVQSERLEELENLIKRFEE